MLVMTNSGAGRVRAEDATIYATAANPSIQNRASIDFGGGRNRVFGNLFNYETGTVTVAGDADVVFYGRASNSGVISASAGARVTMLGGLSGNGVAGDGRVAIEGVVQPGSEPLASLGAMQFGGDVAFGGSSQLEIQVNDALRDLVAADGVASLDGTLQLTALGPISASRSVPIVTAGELLGQFSEIPALNAHLGGGVRFGGIDYDYDQDEVRVSLLSGLAGDFNLDGAVDGSDFLVWQQQLGSPAAAVGLGADADCNGLVDSADLALWRADITAAARGALQPTQTAIPEPAAMTLALLAMATLTALRRR